LQAKTSKKANAMRLQVRVCARLIRRKRSGSVVQGQERPASDLLLAPVDRLAADEIATTILNIQE
jgi:hypothetical protein